MPQQVRRFVARLRGAPIVILDPGPGEVVVAIAACGKLHTDLHHREIDINGEFPFLVPRGRRRPRVGRRGDVFILNWRAVCGQGRAAVSTTSMPL